MADSDEPARKPSEPSKDAQATAPESAKEPAKPGRLSFTIDAASGAMLSVEAVEETGARRALTAKEKTALAKQVTRHTLRDILETTFEAGIASVLDDDDEDDEAETAEDVKFRHLVVGPMMARSAARRFMQREILGQAILAALIEQAPAAAPAKAAPTPSRARAATSSHHPSHRVTRH